jgi:hypothetical protein
VESAPTLPRQRDAVKDFFPIYAAEKSNDHCPFREEKQTDVAIGATIVADALTDKFDRTVRRCFEIR